MRFAFAAVIATVLAWSGAASAQKKIQCWNDKEGHRMCGDRVPPEYAGQKRETIGQQGRVVQTTKAAKTPEEIAEEKRQKEAEEAQKKQAAYDRDLLETYRSAKDLESMRDERVALIESRINSNKKGIEDTDKQLADLRARAEKLKADGKPMDDKLTKQIKQFEKAQKNNAQGLERAQKERVDVETKFNADIARYNELKGAAKAAKAPPPPASAAAPAPATAPAPAPAKK